MKFTIYDKTSKKDVEQKKSFLGGLAIFKQLRGCCFSFEGRENHHMSQAIVLVFRKFASIKMLISPSSSADK